MMVGSKVVNVEEAVEKVPDKAVIAVSGFNLLIAPEYLLLKLYERYKETGHPKHIFLELNPIPTAPGKVLDQIATELYNDPDQEFLSGLLITYPGWSPALQKMIQENRIEGYTWSIGTASWFFREVSRGLPGVLTRVGLGTFLDPREDGGYLNDLAKEKRRCWIDVITIDGKEYLLYRAPKPNVAFIRGTTADEIGNLTTEKEGSFTEILTLAQAAKAEPEKGIVIAQVERIAKYPSLKPQDVKVPGPLIDYVVIAPPEYHKQSANIQYDPRISGEIIPPLDPKLVPKFELSTKKVIARRILLEMLEICKKLKRPILVNLGIGIPDKVAGIAIEEGVQDYVFTTVESGPFGGLALGGPDFGASIGPFAIISQPDQFANYEGGIIDAASLGFMQVDEKGNVNPSLLPGRLPGPGGFPVIAYGSPRMLFAGHFTAGKKDIRVENGKLNIVKDGNIKKFVKSVYKIVYNAALGLEKGQEVKYITERAVFRLTKDGLVLEEYAPELDIDRDILSKMEFEPKVSPKLKEMDERLFKEEPMGLRDEL
ncbi:acyl CoA:acetate/3-ketoacid CoA transferase [Thermococcus barophilus]|nr:malonate decarboxylase subunit alpha [Thermococcus barophilus]